jgi:hypothetical protein
MACSDGDNNDEYHDWSLLGRFDSLCVSYGDEEVMEIISHSNSESGESLAACPVCETISLLEIQELSMAVASQLFYRYGCPDYVLVDGMGYMVVEAVALLACMRLHIPFVPVSVLNDSFKAGTSISRLQHIVDLLRRQATNRAPVVFADASCTSAHVVAISYNEELDDYDPVLGIWSARGIDIHQVLRMDSRGNLREQLPVPTLPLSIAYPPNIHHGGAVLPWTHASNDALYILFTSGSTAPDSSSSVVESSESGAKAVVGSHRSTSRRLQWFANTFDSTVADDGDGILRGARKTKLTFVDGITELLGTILFPQNPQSIRLVSIEPPLLLDQYGIGAFWDTAMVPVEYQPSQITMIPSQLEPLLIQWQKRKTLPMSSKELSLVPPPLQRIIVSGEVCTERVWNLFRSVFEEMSCAKDPGSSTSNEEGETSRYTCQLINLYGQTESTGDATAAVLTDLPLDQVVCDGHVTVGRSITGTRISLRPSEDASRALVGSLNPDVATISKPEGPESHEPARLPEILVSGNLGVGYLRFQGLEPFAAAFGTGDTGFTQNGLWYVTGRVNSLEKINGTWVSPSMVESALSHSLSVLGPQLGVGRVAVSILDRFPYALVECTNPLHLNCWSRDAMKSMGYPWGVIPLAIFDCRQLPVLLLGGSSKLDRAQVKVIISAKLRSAEASSGDEAFEGGELTVRILAGAVLQTREIDVLKSFVHHGGDSAKAVALLYQLRRTRPATNLNSLDILLADSISEIQDIFDGAPRIKRARMSGSLDDTPRYKPCDPHIVRLNHAAIPLQACVDAKAVPHDDFIFIACQGGVVAKIRPAAPSQLESSAVIAHQRFSPWMFQAGCMPVTDDKNVIVCGHSREDRGTVLCLSCDSLSVTWQHEFEGGVFSNPAVVDISHKLKLLVVLGGRHHVRCYHLRTGVIHGDIILPEAVVTRPVSTLAGDLVYFSADCDSQGPMVLKCAAHEGMSEFHAPTPGEGDNMPVISLTVAQQSTECEVYMGPVHKDPCVAQEGEDTTTAIFSDTWGTIHVMDLATWNVSSLKLMDCPLSSPSVACQDSSNDSTSDLLFAVGGYDGTVRGIQYKQHRRGSLVQLWVVNVFSSVYSTPLVVDQRGPVIVATTAGKLWELGSQSASQALDDSGILPSTEMKLIRQITELSSAEIWSDPVCCGDHSTIVFGARDSRLHWFQRS